MNTEHSILLIAIASGITFLIRAFPFLVFKKRQMPAFLKEIADKLPPAIIAVLVIYCLKGPLTVLDTETIAAAIAIAGVVILHLWKRNTLLYGVEVKFYNMEVSIDENLETRHKGLYIIGDGSGVTHSLSHASASGVFVARRIMEGIE